MFRWGLLACLPCGCWMLLPPPVAPGVGSRAKGASEQKCHIPAPLRPPLTGLSHRGHGVRKGMFPWNDSLGRHVLPPGGSAHPANLWKLLGAILPRCLFLSRLQAASSSNFSTLHVFQIRYRELSPLKDTPRPPDDSVMLEAPESSLSGPRFLRSPAHWNLVRATSS
jgi:hypothetical protein